MPIRLFARFIQPVIAGALLCSLQSGCSMLPWHRQPAAAVAPSAVARGADAQSADARVDDASGQALPAGRAETAGSRQREVDELVNAALTAPQMDQRTIAALRASDRAIAGLADTVTAIEQAEKVVVDNLRNADTTGFKATRAVASDKRDVSIQLDLAQGSLANTGRNLDLAIQGEGFFAVKISDKIGGGIGYSRNGNLFVNNQGQLILGIGDGFKLMPPMVVPSGMTDISVSQDGLVQGLKAGSTAKQNIGQLILCRFINPTGLQRIDSNIYTETETSGKGMETKPGENGSGQVIQGFLEQSNVDLNRERLRLRFLQNWRDTLVHAIDGDTPALARPAAATELGR